jgi:hypothetical protein
MRLSLRAADLRREAVEKAVDDVVNWSDLDDMDPRDLFHAVEEIFQFRGYEEVDHLAEAAAESSHAADDLKLKRPTYEDDSEQTEAEDAAIDAAETMQNTLEHYVREQVEDVITPAIVWIEQDVSLDDLDGLEGAA